MTVVLPTALSVTGLGLRLLRNAARYRWLRRTGRPGTPLAVSIEVTQRCIAHCVMCGIWRAPAVSDMALERWLALLSDPLLADLRELDITGGEPFLRDDLPDLVDGVARLKGSRLYRLRSVAITTNGLLTDRVLAGTERMAAALATAGLDLIVVCALDAVGPLHDEIRAVPRAWERLEATLQGLMRLRAAHPNLILGHKTTVLPRNVHELARIDEYARAHGLFSIISPFIITGGRYLNADLGDQFEFSPDERAALARFYRRAGSGWDYHSRAMAEYLETGCVRKPCSCGFNYFFVRSSGEVMLCPLLEDGAGSLEDAAIGDLWVSPAASRLRRGIGDYDECRRCTEPGLERFALPYEGLAYLRLLRDIGPGRFLEMHRHMGLDKYV